MMQQYMQVIWLYLIGISVITVGLYLLMTNYGAVSFIVMLAGLGVAAFGSAHGRRLRMMGQFDMQEAMQGEVDEEEVPPQNETEEAQVPEEKAEPAEQEIADEHPATGGGGLFGFLRRGGREQQEPVETAEAEIEEIKEGRLIPTVADIIELICPKCGAENDERNFFCYKCGNRLRRKEKGSEEEKKPIPIEPGSIEIIEGTRVAKVVICPKCNSSNKVGDRFCWNCGKKLKKEHTKNVKVTVSKK